MRPNQRILKSFAIVLLLVFSQKIAGGLYLHNWLHQKNCKQSTHSTGTNVVGYTCTCVEDFSIPFAEAPACFNQPVPSIEVEFIGFHKFLVPYSSSFFYSLRGPPAV
jgi:hypothetical protein